MDCSTAEGGISPLVNGVVWNRRTRKLQWTPQTCFSCFHRLLGSYEFVDLLFFVASLESLIVSSTLAFVCQECAHAQALNRYIALALVPTLTWFKGV